jgi:lipopolysaccharide export system permease protein
MLKQIDLYIIRKFLGTFAFAIFLFILIAIVIDLTEKVDDIIDDDIPIDKVIFGYYTNFIPYITALLTPLFIFITVIFFTSRMASNMEIIAILGNGVSYYRILVPYLMAAGLLALMLYYANHWLIPQANMNRIKFENKYMHSVGRFNEKNLHMQIDTGKFIYMKTYDHDDSTGYHVTLERIKNGRLLSKLRAKRMKWNGAERTWTLQHYHVRKFQRGTQVLKSGGSKDTTINLYPNNISRSRKIKEAMPNYKLLELIEQKRQRGTQGIEFLQVERYRRTADAFAILVLAMIGLSIASRKVSGGIGLHIVLGLVIAAGFIVFSRFFTTFSTNGNLHPILGTWFPNIIFSLLAIILIRFAPK